MAQFPKLLIEKEVQTNDKTRLNARQSYVSVGSTALTTLTVKPGADGSAISVFNADETLRYLDWEFTAFNGDFDATNNKIDFKENDGSELTATIDTGTYTLAQLATEVQTQLNSAGALTYTVAIDGVTEKMTISVAGDNKFSLLPTEGTNAEVSALPLLGFYPKGRVGRDDLKFANSASLTGKPVEKLHKRITVESGDGSSTESITQTIVLYSEDGDKLFSSDQDLMRIQADIIEYIRPGRSSFNDYHRQAQQDIVNWMDENGFVDINGEKMDKYAIIDIEEVNDWSTYKTLGLIFRDFIKSNDDGHFIAMKNEFDAKAERAQKRVVLRLDIDNDGKSELGEHLSVRSGRLIRQ